MSRVSITSNSHGTLRDKARHGSVPSSVPWACRRATFACPLKGQCNDSNYGHPQDDHEGLIQNLWLLVTLIGFELGPWRETLHLGRKRDLELYTGSFKGF